MKALIDFSSITDNFLDKTFQNVLFPYRFLQHLLFLSRFSIEYNCIRPHGTFYYIFSFIGTTGLISYMFFCTGPRSFKKISSVLDAFFVVNSCVLIVPFYVFYAITLFKGRIMWNWFWRYKSLIGPLSISSINRLVCLEIGLGYSIISFGSFSVSYYFGVFKFHFLFMSWRFSMWIQRMVCHWYLC